LRLDAVATKHVTDVTFRKIVGNGARTASAKWHSSPPLSLFLSLSLPLAVREIKTNVRRLQQQQQQQQQQRFGINATCRFEKMRYGHTFWNISK